MVVSFFALLLADLALAACVVVRFIFCICTFFMQERFCNLFSITTLFRVLQPYPYFSSLHCRITPDRQFLVNLGPITLPPMPKRVPAPAPHEALFDREIERFLATLLPCARQLYHWLLRQGTPGQPQEIFLKEFVEFTAYRKSGGYSLVQIKRAFNQLTATPLVDVVHKYSGFVYKLTTYDAATFPLHQGDRLDPRPQSPSDPEA
jgi:hypothetical protein